MNETKDDETNNPERGGTTRALTMNWELYGRYLEASELSEDDKREFAQTVWNIMVAFVDLGYRLSPVEQTCGQLDLTAALAAAADHAVLECQTMDKTNDVETAAASAVEKGAA